MKNRNGQVLVIFIILIPVFLMLGALIVDTGLMINRKISINNAVSNEKDIDKIKASLDNNNITYKNVKEENECIIIDSRVNSIFGKIIGKKEYKIIYKKCK